MGEHLSCYAVIDFETTGMSPALGARATEIGICIVEDGRIVDRYQSLINPGQLIPCDIQQLTGITNAMVRTAPPASEVMSAALAFVGGRPLLAHNASFDAKFWQAGLSDLGRRDSGEWLCSLKLARRVFPALASYRLSALAAHLRLPQAGQFHRALADAQCTAHLAIAAQRQLCSDYQLAEAPCELLLAVQAAAKRQLAKVVAPYQQGG